MPRAFSPAAGTTSRSRQPTASRSASLGRFRPFRRQTRIPAGFVLFFTCAGGSQNAGYLATATRNRLLRRALSFEPQKELDAASRVVFGSKTPPGYEAEAGCAVQLGPG